MNHSLRPASKAVRAAADKRGPNLPISNPKQLASLVTAATDSFPSQRAAARATGISQSLLSRLQNATLREIDLGNYLKLGSLIPKDQHELFDRAFIPKGAQVLRKRYAAWLARITAMASLGVGERLVRTPNGFETRRYDAHEGAQTPRDDERTALWECVRVRSPQLVREAEAFFNRFPTGRLALARVLDPLLNTAESGFHEVSWRELAAHNYKDLTRIIALGIKRERLLAPKQNSVSRLVEVYKLSRGEFIERFGDQAVDVSLFVRPARAKR
jgi:hypothetical protein